MTTPNGLRDAIERLEEAYQRDRADLVRDGHDDPELVRDTAGRFVLLDALISITNGRAALALAHEAGMKTRPERAVRRPAPSAVPEGGEWYWSRESGFTRAEIDGSFPLARGLAEAPSPSRGGFSLLAFEREWQRLFPVGDRANLLRLPAGDVPRGSMDAWPVAIKSWEPTYGYLFRAHLAVTGEPRFKIRLPPPKERR